MVENIYVNHKNAISEITSAEECFLALSDLEKEEVQKNSVEVDFKKGETIIKKGFVASSIIYLKHGIAKLDIEIDGKTATVGLIPEKSFIGIICTFANRNLNFSSVALEKSRVVLMDIQVLEKLIRQNGEFAFLLIKHMSWLTNQIIHQITRYSHKNIDGSLSILLLDFAAVYKSDLYTIPVNRKEMANIIGYSKESVINTLSKFKRDGLIEITGHEVKILNREMMQQISNLG